MRNECMGIDFRVHNPPIGNSLVEALMPSGNWAMGHTLRALEWIQPGVPDIAHDSTICRGESASCLGANSFADDQAVVQWILSASGEPWSLIITAPGAPAGRVR
jgi:hypothetical protein